MGTEGAKEGRIKNICSGKYSESLPLQTQEEIL